MEVGRFVPETWVGTVKIKATFLLLFKARGTASRALFFGAVRPQNWDFSAVANISSIIASNDEIHVYQRTNPLGLARGGGQKVVIAGGIAV